MILRMVPFGFVTLVMLMFSSTELLGGPEVGGNLAKGNGVPASRLPKRGTVVTDETRGEVILSAQIQKSME